MGKRITKKQIKDLKESLDNLNKSNEQFVFVLYKNKNGSDQIVGCSYNMSIDKLKYYLGKELGRAVIKNENKN